VFLTDVAGVLGKDKKLIESMTTADAGRFIKNGTITGGMVPKIKSAAEAVKCGVGSVAIVDGRIDHTVLLEIFTDEGMGTLITR
jgi:acetylglutamate kinase